MGAVVEEYFGNLYGKFIMIQATCWIMQTEIVETGV
jgi:hypothetical protein